MMAMCGGDVEQEITIEAYEVHRYLQLYIAFVTAFGAI